MRQEIDPCRELIHKKYNFKSLQLHFLCSLTGLFHDD